MVSNNLFSSGGAPSRPRRGVDVNVFIFNEVDPQVVESTQAEMNNRFITVVGRFPYPLPVNGSPLRELQNKRISPTEPVAILSAWVSRQSRNASFTASSLSIQM